MQGQCFSWAAKYAIDHPDSKVCHAVVTAPCSRPPHRYVHGWVEHNGLCLDWQTMVAGHGGPKFCGIGYPIDVFYALFSPENTIEYTPTEALRLMTAQGHWGPWVTDFDDVIVEQMRRIPSKRSA